jgi:hypothetical protein
VQLLPAGNLHKFCRLEFASAYSIGKIKRVEN